MDVPDGPTGGSDELRFFPYDRPYRNQREAMDRIANALSRGQDVLFEGACGTGKTLSALVPALAHARNHDKTVVITTNVHQQMRQFVTEARAITRTEPIRTVVFRGKSSMCHIDVGYEECQILRDNTHDLVELESDVASLERRQRALLDRARAGDDEAMEGRSAVMDELDALEADLADRRDRRTCDFYRNNLTGDTVEFHRWLFDDVRTPDDVYEYADRNGFCGYELLKDGMGEVDLVVCNYHHLLDPFIRDRFFRWIKRDPESVIVVFDEAHNIEDAARQHATRTLAERTIRGAMSELEEVDDPRREPAVDLVGAFLRALTGTYDEALGFGEREGLGERWTDLRISNDDGRDDLTMRFLDEYAGRGIDRDLEAAVELGRTLDRRYEEAYRSGEIDTRRECRIRQVATFVDAWLEEGGNLGRYPVVSVRRDPVDDEVRGRAELYTCIPRSVTEELFDQVYASVLMSATLRPFDVLGDVMGLSDPVTLAYGLSFPGDRRRTFTVATPPLFASDRDDPAVQSAIASVIADAIRMTPGNTLCFFPSYREADRYHDRLADDLEATAYLDAPGQRAEPIRRAFAAGDRGALFTSLWGTLTEGVSFDDDEARTVMVVGVPYPHLDDRTQAVQDAYGAMYGDRGSGRSAEAIGWEYAVQIPTIRKTRQAIGRVVRSPEDYGVRLLVDERYTERGTNELGKYSVHGAFPPEERDEMIDVDPDKVKFAMLNFFGDLDAYDGSPPDP